MFVTSLSRQTAENLRWHLWRYPRPEFRCRSGTVAGSAQGHASVDCWHDRLACRVSGEQEAS